MKKLGIFLAVLLSLCSAAFAQISGAGQLTCNGATVSGTAATSGTSVNTVLYTLTNTSAWGVMVQLTQTSTISGGVISFQTSSDGTATYTNLSTLQVLNKSTAAQLTNPYTLVASTNQEFLILLSGAANFQVKLTTAITGSATVTPFITPLCYAGLQAMDERTIAGTVVDTNSGSKSAGTQRVVLATDQPQLTAKLLVTPDSVEAPNVATASTTNAALLCAILSTASTNSTSCKGSAGNMYGFWVVNTTATVYYLRIYNASSAPTCSSATGFIQSVPIPASTSGAGVVVPFAIPAGFSTGIGYCLTGGSSSTDNTNAATGVFGQILYK